MSSVTKQTLRTALLNQRRQLTTKIIEKKSQQIFQNFLKHESELFIPNVKSVGLYSPIQNEVDTTLFCNHFIKKGLKILFPRVEGDQIQFYPVANSNELHPGQFKIPEPKAQNQSLLPEILFIPGIGFHKKTGARIGFGKGFYDRFFEANHGITIRKIGLSFHFQIVPTFPADPTDICMDFVLTENKLMSFSI